MSLSGNTQSRWALALLLALLAGGCGFRSRPNVLLITLDTTRTDRLGCYGSARALTPALDDLAGAGVVFEEAYATVPLTLPSHATILTGRYPPEHGLRINGEGVLPADVPTLAELLARRGYRTGAFVSAFVLNRKFGLDRGFEIYDDELAGGAYVETELYRSRPGAAAVDAAIEWLTGNRRGRFFCWVHLFDPHVPYDPHAELWGTKFADQPYDAEIAYVDLQVDRLMQFLRETGRDRNTLIVIAGDHGEGLGEHNEPTHGYMLYNTTMHVPLLIVRPEGSTEGARVSEPVSLVDLAPTILDLLGGLSDGEFSGRSLVPLLDKAGFEDRACWGETELPLRGHGWSPQQMLVARPWKFIRSAKPELYNVADDPRELTNALSAGAGVAQDLGAELDRFNRSMRQRTASAAGLSESDREILESLGYVGGARSAGPETNRLASLADIKDRIAAVTLVTEAKALAAAGRSADAVKLFREAVQVAPDQAGYRQYLALALSASGESEEAERILRSLLETTPDDVEVLNRLAVVVFQSGRKQEALELCRRAIEANPEVDGSYVNLGSFSASLGDNEAAIRAYSTAIRLNPNLVKARLGLGDIYSRLGRDEEAREQWEAARRTDPANEAARARLGF